ncbi:MAG: cytochrome c [Bacteroidetes bacterium]|nr:cytochrome c [Bacteroidota bacterium]
MKKRNLVFTVASSLLLATVLMSQTKKPAAPAKTAGATASGGASASITRGKQVYLEQCLACHQVDGAGVQGMNPPLVKTKFVLGDKNTLVKIVLNGMQGVEVEGEEYHGVMAPHSDLTDAQIADVLTYVRNSFGNKAKAVTAAEVKAIRAKNKPA